MPLRGFRKVIARWQKIPDVIGREKDPRNSAFTPTSKGQVRCSSAQLKLSMFSARSQDQELPRKTLSPCHLHSPLRQLHYIAAQLRTHFWPLFTFSLRQRSRKGSSNRKKMHIIPPASYFDYAKNSELKFCKKSCNKIPQKFCRKFC